MQERRPIVQPLSQVRCIWPALFVDDAAGTFAYSLSGTGSGYVGDYAASLPLVGDEAIRLRTRSASAAQGDVVNISKSLWSPPTKLVRIQFAFTRELVQNSFFYIWLNWYNGTTRCIPELNFTTSNSNVYYATTLHATYVDTGMDFDPGQYHWNYVDWRINLDSEIYHIIKVNENTHHPDNVSVPTAVSSVAPYLQVVFQVECAANAQSGFFIDQILITPENP